MAENSELTEIRRAIAGVSRTVPRLLKTLVSKGDVEMGEGITFIRNIALVVGFAETIIDLKMFQKSALAEAMIPILLKDIEIAGNSLKALGAHGEADSLLERLTAYRETVEWHRGL